MRLLVLGAAGRVGRRVVDEALARGHHITAFVRSADTFSNVSSRIKVVRGDVRDRRGVEAAMPGHDAVIYAIGAGNVRHTTLFSESARVVLEAMRAAHVRRLVCVTGVGAGDTRGHGGFFYDWILYPLFTKGIYADKDRQEALIQVSDTDWTIVRPASFVSRAGSTPLQAVTRVERDTVLRKISIHEVAVFVVDEIEQSRFVRQAVFIGHG